MLNENFTKMLDLKNAKIKNLNVDEKSVTIDIKYPVVPYKCPVCGYVTSLIHDYQIQKVRNKQRKVK